MLLIFWGRSFFVAGSVLQPGAVGGWGQGSRLINWPAQTRCPGSDWSRWSVAKCLQLLSSPTNCAGEWSETRALSIIAMWTQTQTKVLWCYFPCETNGLMLSWSETKICTFLCTSVNLDDYLQSYPGLGAADISWQLSPAFLCWWAAAAADGAASTAQLHRADTGTVLASPPRPVAHLQVLITTVPSQPTAASVSCWWLATVFTPIPATSHHQHQHSETSGSKVQQPAQPSPAQPSTTPSPIVIVTHTSTANHRNHHQEHFTTVTMLCFSRYVSDQPPAWPDPDMFPWVWWQLSVTQQVTTTVIIFQYFSVKYFDFDEVTCEALSWSLNGRTER